MADKPDTTPVGVGEGARAPKHNPVVTAWDVIRPLEGEIVDVQMAVCLMETVIEALFSGDNIVAKSIREKMPLLKGYEILVFTEEQFSALHCTFGVVGERAYKLKRVFDALCEAREAQAA